LSGAPLPDLHKVVDKALAESPPPALAAQATLLKGILYYLQGDFAPAREIFGTIPTRFPSERAWCALALEWKGYYHGDIAEFKEAIATFDQLQAAYPDQEHACALAEIDRTCLAGVFSSTQRSPEQSRQARRQTVRALLDLLPRYQTPYLRSTIYFYAGSMLEEVGDLEQAVEMYQRVSPNCLSFRPLGGPDALLRVASCEVKLGRFSKALSHAQMFASRYPHHVGLASARHLEDWVSHYLLPLQRSLSPPEGEPDPTNLLSRAMAHLAVGDRQVAAQIYARLLANQPPPEVEREARYNLAMIALSCNDSPTAIEHLRVLATRFHETPEGQIAVDHLEALRVHVQEAPWEKEEPASALKAQISHLTSLLVNKLTATHVGWDMAQVMKYGQTVYDTLLDRLEAPLPEEAVDRFCRGIDRFLTTLPAVPSQWEVSVEQERVRWLIGEFAGRHTDHPEADQQIKEQIREFVAWLRSQEVQERIPLKLPEEKLEELQSEWLLMAEDPFIPEMKQVLAPEQVDTMKALVLQDASSVGAQEDIETLVGRIRGRLEQMTALPVAEALRELLEVGDTEPEEEEKLFAQASPWVGVFGYGVMGYEQKLYLLRCLLSVVQASKRSIGAVRRTRIIERRN
jgi:tetratricopeptide (TPR) repeat protein